MSTAALPVAAPEKSTRLGGRYLPPARLRELQARITDKNSEDYQRLSWEALKKSINGLINKVNVSNIKEIVPELISLNLIRGRGVFCRAIIKSQAASQPFTAVYAALVAVINSRFPAIGELLMKRLILQFRRAYRISDKSRLLSATMFLAHLTNHKVAHEIVALQILTLLLETPTDDSVEVATAFTKQAGAFVESVAPKAMNAVFDRFRTILHEGTVQKRTQYMVEVLFQIRKEKFEKFPSIIKDLDLVDDDEQITHTLGFDDDEDLKAEENLNVFRYDPEYLENEQKYTDIKHEILGSSEDEDSTSEDEHHEPDDSDEERVDAPAAQPGKMTVFDHTHRSTIQLRKTIYLTISSSLDFEECCHKLLKLKVQPGQEIELCNMIIECCSQEQSFMKFYALIGERFAKLNRLWREKFEESFIAHYETVHRYEINRLRNVAKFFGHQLATDAIAWTVMRCIELRLDATTSSSRIFLQILFQELKEALGMEKLKQRLFDPAFQESFKGLFPKDNPRDTRFAVNFLTAIELGPLTEDLREWLRNAPKIIMAQQRQLAGEESLESGDDSDDSDATSSDDKSSSDPSTDSSDSSEGPLRKRWRTADEGSGRKGHDRTSVRREPSPDQRTVRHRRKRSETPPHRRHSERRRDRFGSLGQSWQERSRSRDRERSYRRNGRSQGSSPRRVRSGSSESSSVSIKREDDGYRRHGRRAHRHDYGRRSPVCMTDELDTHRRKTHSRRGRRYSSDSDSGQLSDNSTDSRVEDRGRWRRSPRPEQDHSQRSRGPSRPHRSRSESASPPHKRDRRARYYERDRSVRRRR